MGLLSTIGAASGRAFGFTRSAIAAATDAFFNRVTLLLPGNGTNGAQNNTFLDSSTNNFTITRNGNTTQGTFSPFSQTGWGNYFNGSTDYLSIADNAALELGSGSFTVEAWVWTSSTAAQTVITKRNGIAAFNFVLYLSGGTAVQLYCSSNGSSFDMFSGASVGTITLNTWNHITIQRSGNNWYGSVNGTVTSLGTNSSTVFNNANPWLIGADAGANYVTGYISNVRIVTGSAVYGASNFTVPTTPLTAISGTQLLTCQPNRFVDNSTNAFAITVNGTPSVQAFSPFAPTAAYSAATVGGSGYFDGTTDYLTLPYSSQLQFTGNFTIEFWAYPLTQVNNFSGVFNNYSSWPSSTGVAIFCGHSSASSTKWCVALFGTFPAITSTNDYVKNAWSHIALVRNGTGTNNITLYVNGVASGTTTSNNTVTGTADNWWISTTGDGASTQTFTGYLSGFRAINSAEYTSNFTPPTAPLTAGSNKLLLNFTNAGITDATAKNDLETVGNAQISTTQSKFGGSSMLFDGTGDYLLFPSSPNLAFGTGDYTVEAWVYFTSLSVSVLQIIFRSGAGGNNFYFHVDGDQISVGTGSTFISNQATTFNTNTWYHIAACRSGTTLRLFRDGTQVGSSVTDSTNWVSTGTAGVGSNETGIQTVFGYIDDLRVSRYARYTTNFTPPTTAFPLQ